MKSVPVKMNRHVVIIMQNSSVSAKADNTMPKRMLKVRLYSKRRKERPRKRWLDDVESDLKKMKVKG
jgi:hypothetical protein